MGKKRWKVGDRVTWTDRNGLPRTGHIERVAVSPGHTRQNGPYEATKKDPCFIVTDDLTGDRSLHTKHDFLNA